MPRPSDFVLDSDEEDNATDMTYEEKRQLSSNIDRLTSKSIQVTWIRVFLKRYFWGSIAAKLPAERSYIAVFLVFMTRRGELVYKNCLNG